MCLWFTEWSSISTWILVLGLLVLVMNLFISSQGNGFWMFAILTLNHSVKTLWWFGHEKKQCLNTHWVHFPCCCLTVCVNFTVNPIGWLILQKLTSKWVSFRPGSFPSMAVCIASWVAVVAKEGNLGQKWASGPRSVGMLLLVMVPPYAHLILV